MTRPMTGPVQREAVRRGRLPVGGRDRRPALAALALLLVVAGALGAALVAYRSGHRTDVLVAAHEIKPGQRVDSSDFSVARVATDAGGVVPASQEQSFVGSYATTDIPAGTLINHVMFKVGDVLPTDGVVVGVTLSVDQRPATTIAAGDVVRAYLVPKSGQGTNSTAQQGQVLVDAARVVSVQSNTSDTVTASLLVSSTDAPPLVTAAAQGSVALAALPNTTKPTIDYRTGS
jgi:hypothetical protein